MPDRPGASRSRSPEPESTSAPARRGGSSTPELETRWPCPVCLGVKLEKIKTAESGELVLDHCRRCGGVWFELGEVQALRSEDPEALWTAIERRESPHPARCRACLAHLHPDSDRCPACGEKARLECPHCQRRMRRVRRETEGASADGGEARRELVLDVCESCKGVWFDHHELATIWMLERDKLVAGRRERGKLAKAADGSVELLEALVWAPDLAFYGAHVAGHALAAAAEGLAAAPEAIGGAAEAVAEVASSVFEVIVEIVSGIFS